MNSVKWLAIVALIMPSLAHANGRPPITNGVRFQPGNDEAIYVATTFGLLVSSDSCHFYWVCETNIGYGGEFDPVYGVSSSGALMATTFNGLRVSRDGGCSFTTATAQLPTSDPGNISMHYLSALEIGPTGEVWVGSSDTPADNDVFISTDDAVTFGARGALPPAMWIESIKIAPSDPLRVYVTGFQISSVGADGGNLPPSAHLFRSDDGGATWTELALANIAFNNQPLIFVLAIDPTNEDIVYMSSQLASPPGDVLYRSADGATTFATAVTTTDAIRGVVVHDAQTVLVATQVGGSFRSTDAGVTFAPLANAPQLECLGQRGDGVLFGCGANYAPDQMALAMSTDGNTWQRVLEFEYMSGPLSCPTSTVQYATCANQMWGGIVSQFGVMPATCSSGPAGGDGVPSDAPTSSKKSGGCCDAGDPVGVAWALAIALTTRRRRRRAAVATRTR